MIYFDERGEVIPEMEGRGGVLPKWHILYWKLAGTSPSQEIGPYIQKITDGHWKLKSVPGQQLHAGSQVLQRSETPEEDIYITTIIIVIITHFTSAAIKDEGWWAKSQDSRKTVYHDLEVVSISSTKNLKSEACMGIEASKTMVEQVWACLDQQKTPTSHLSANI